jgi:hypothetical protein
VLPGRAAYCVVLLLATGPGLSLTLSHAVEKQCGHLAGFVNAFHVCWHWSQMQENAAIRLCDITGGRLADRTARCKDS